MRIIDPAAIEAARKHYCEVCGTQAGPFEVHHISARGMGGAKGDDVDVNLVNLCAGARVNCHDDAHAGRIPRERLEIIAQSRQGGS